MVRRSRLLPRWTDSKPHRSRTRYSVSLNEVTSRPMVDPFALQGRPRTATMQLPDGEDDPAECGGADQRPDPARPPPALHGPASPRVARRRLGYSGVQDRIGVLGPYLHGLPSVRLAGHLVHVWSTRHRNRAVRNGLQRCIVRPGSRSNPPETGPGAEP
jgi:hypothetical protein